MARTRVAKLAFNRGLVSRLGLARADIKRLALAATTHLNWMVRVLGSMMLRPGMGYLGNTKGNLQPKYVPFVFATNDTAIVELTNGSMRVWKNDAVIQRVAVATAIVNGTFDANLGSWTDSDDAGATSAWVAGGYMSLIGTGTLSARRRQQVAVAAPALNVRHALHIVIFRGDVTLKVGNAAGDDTYINTVTLHAGVHSLTVTPVGDIYIELAASSKAAALVDSIAIEAAGDMVLATPWLTANLRSIRWDQSGDVLFLACEDIQQRRIERRSNDSWSIVVYEPGDGPFETENTGPITIAASAISGDITLTASQALFRAGHLGAIFSLTSGGQTVSSSISAADTFTNVITITNVGTTRGFSVSLSGVWVATVTLQRSFDEGASWIDVASYTVNTAVTFADGLDNQEIQYRIGVKAADYTSGTVVAQLTFTLGSITGVARITAVTSTLIATAAVLTDLGSTTATDVWSEGSWSTQRGFPSSVSFHEGRLWWAGVNGIDGSISDAFDGFDPAFEGDAAPINRTIGSGPVDTINWLLSLQRLMMGADGAEFSVRSSSLDEPLTPTNFNIKQASTQGSGPVAAVKVDQNAVFVQRGGTRVFELAFGQTGIDYEATQLSALIPEIGQPGIIGMCVQRQPDTRVHFWRSDGTVAVLVFDKVEQVICWLEVETDGEVEDVCVLPATQGTEEDRVYYAVKRTINGSTVRFFEKWALESECRGDAQLCKLADAFVTYTGVATTTVTAAHLAGEQVVIWADGADVGTDDDGDQLYTLNGAGQATLPAAVTNYVVGMPYTAQWESAKLVELMAQLGGTLTAPQIIKSLSLILADIHPKGVQYGQTLTDLQDLPELGEEGQVLDPDAVMTDYVVEQIAFPGQWSSDARICLQAKAPRPATVLAALAEVEHNG